MRSALRRHTDAGWLSLQPPRAGVLRVWRERPNAAYTDDDVLFVERLVQHVFCTLWKFNAADVRPDQHGKTDSSKRREPFRSFR